MKKAILSDDGPRQIYGLDVTMHYPGYICPYQECGCEYLPDGTNAEVLRHMITFAKEAGNTEIRAGLECMLEEKLDEAVFVLGD